MEKRYNVLFWQLLVIGLHSDTDISTYTGVHHIWGNVRIKEKIDFDKLKESINFFIEKNDSIRTRFCFENGKLWQYFAEFKPFDFPIIDVKDETDVDNLLKEMQNVEYSLLEDYFFSIKLYRYPQGDGGILLHVNHAIADGWSIGLAAYETINHYIGKFVFPITGSYKDYIKNKDKYEKSNRVARDKEYWDDLLKNGIPEPPTFPAKRELAPNFSWESDKITIDLDESRINKIREFCLKNRISLSKFFMSCYGLLLSRYSGSRKFLMNSMSANRKNIKERLTTGMFSMMTLYMFECPNMKMIDLMKNTDRSMNNAYRHREYLSKHLFELSSAFDSTHRGRFTNGTFSYQSLNMKTNNKDLDYEITGDNNTTTAGMDYTIHILDLESSNQIQIIYDYLVERNDREDFIKINDQIMSIIDQVLANEEIYIDDIIIDI